MTPGTSLLIVTPHSIRGPPGRDIQPLVGARHDGCRDGPGITAGDGGSGPWLASGHRLEPDQREAISVLLGFTSATEKATGHARCGAMDDGR